MKENLLNFALVGWTFLTLSEWITWGVGILGGMTLVWMNIERALRASRKNERTATDGTDLLRLRDLWNPGRDRDRGRTDRRPPDPKPRTRSSRGILSRPSAEDEQRQNPQTLRKIDEIVIHCTATTGDRRGDVSADEVRSWHTSPPRNWSDIGYHFLIRRDGSLEGGRDLDRPGGPRSGDE